MKVRRIDFSPDEWLQGAYRLGNAERGLYITACSLIYSKGGPIEIEELRIATRDHGNAFNRQLKKLISLGKLEETDGKSLGNAQHLTNKRCESELGKAEIRSTNAAENAAKRWETNKSDDAAALPHSNARAGNANHQPSTTTSKKNPQTPAERGLSPRQKGTNPRANGADPWHFAAQPRDQLRARFNATALGDPEHEALRSYLYPNLRAPD